MQFIRLSFLQLFPNKEKQGKEIQKQIYSNQQSNKIKQYSIFNDIQYIYIVRIGVFSVIHIYIHTSKDIYDRVYQCDRESIHSHRNKIVRV